MTRHGDYQIVCARLKLANKRRGQGVHQVASAATFGPGATSQPSETVAFLVGAHLYEDAVRIASAFDPPLDCRPVVEGLAAKCVKLARCQATASSSGHKSDEIELAQEWLADNNPSGVCKAIAGERRDNLGADMPQRSDMAVLDGRSNTP